MSMIQVWSKYGPSMVYVWSKYGSLVEVWSMFGPTVLFSCSELMKMQQYGRMWRNVLECGRMCWNVVKVTSSVIFVREKVEKKSLSSSNRVRKSQNWIRNGQN